MRLAHPNAEVTLILWPALIISWDLVARMPGRSHE
jgi:hypothetical protein